MPRSLAEVKGVKVLPRNNTIELVSCQPMSCSVPRSINFVLSGLINRWFSEHQVVNAMLVLPSGNDRNSLELSTYDSRQHYCGALVRSFK